MRIHQIRNATVVVEAAGQRILVDPMLGAPGTLPPYAVILEFVSLAHGTVVANHLETLNHCPTTRRALSAAATAAGLDA